MKFVTFDSYAEADNFKNSLNVGSSGKGVYVGINDIDQEGIFKNINGRNSSNLPWIKGKKLN